MRQRLDSLEFRESQHYARERYIFVKLFLDKLKNDTTTLEKQQAEYIVFEGISGAGKSSQAKLLHEYLAARNIPVFMIHEPSMLYADLKKQLRSHTLDSRAKLLLFLLDRYIRVSPAIQEALAAGKLAIGDRSYVSTLVYQAGAQWLSPANIAYIHSIVAQPSRILILDIDPEIAHARLVDRTKKDGIAPGEHETLEQLRVHRERFKSISDLFPQAIVLSVDNLDETEIHYKVKKILEL